MYDIIFFVNLIRRRPWLPSLVAALQIQLDCPLHSQIKWKTRHFSSEYIWIHVHEYILKCLICLYIMIFEYMCMNIYSNVWYVYISWYFPSEIYTFHTHGKDGIFHQTYRTRELQILNIYCRQFRKYWKRSDICLVLLLIHRSLIVERVVMFLMSFAAILKS